MSTNKTKKEKKTNNNWVEEYLNNLDKKSMYAETILCRHKPNTLYKYLCLEDDEEAETCYTIENLKNGKLNFKSPKIFNDPYDSLINLDVDALIKDEINSCIQKNIGPIKKYDKSLLINQFSKSNEIKSLSQYAQSDVDQEIDKYLLGCRICCFSEVNDSILMWSHYSRNHEGICIGYNFDELKNKYNMVYPALYTKKFSNMNHLLNKKEIKSKDILKPLLTKYSDWKYEKEWRIIEYKEPTLNNKPEYSCLMEVPKPKEIYMGQKINAKYENKIKEICIDKGITLYKMDILKNQFKLDKKLMYNPEK